MLMRKVIADMNEIIITSPSLNPKENVSGISSVTKFIIDNTPKAQYLHFELGKKDKEKGGWHRIGALIGRYRDWKKMLAEHPDAVIHYNFPVEAIHLARPLVYPLCNSASSKDGGACAWWSFLDSTQDSFLSEAHHAMGVWARVAFHRAERYGEGYFDGAIRSEGGVFLAELCGFEGC